MRLYQPIWQRVRANPGVRVPIECPSSFMQRIILAVKKERAMDKLYNRVSAARNKTGIVYKSTAPHAEKHGMAVVSFILIEYSSLSYSDLKYLVKYPPPQDLNEQIGLKELEAEMFDKIKPDIYSDFNYETAAVQELNQAHLRILKENLNANP